MKLFLILLLLSFPVFSESSNDLDKSETELTYLEDFEFPEIDNNVQPRRRRWLCLSRARRLGFFTGSGQNRWQANRRSIRKCRRIARRPRTCRIVWCNRVF